MIRWLRNSNDLVNDQIDLPLLLIDDESDNASVNTRNIENDPTVINQCIRKILNTFRQSSYIGVTATPFANIFINPAFCFTDRSFHTGILFIIFQLTLSYLPLYLNSFSPLILPRNSYI